MASANARDERRFLEAQIRAVDELMRDFGLMQSTLRRRMRRLQNHVERNRAPQTPPRAAAAAANAPGAPSRRRRGRRVPMDVEENIAPMPLAYMIDPEIIDLMDEMDEMIANPPNIPMEVGEEDVPVRAHRGMPKAKTRAVNKKVLNEPMPEECSVCQETYTKNMCVTLDCKHDICATCYNRWASTQFPEEHRVTCPMCRETIKTVTSYRERAVRRNAAQMAAARANVV